MKKRGLIIIVGLLYLLTTEALPLSAQGGTNVQSYRVGSNVVPGTESWTFTYSDNISSFNAAIIKDVDRYKLLVRSRNHLGDIEIVLEDNSVIRCTRRPGYDHHIDNRLHTLYYLTENEVMQLSSSNIDHIVTNQSPAFQYEVPGNTPRYYRYHNRYRSGYNHNIPEFSRNNTARGVRALLRHEGRSSDTASFPGNTNLNCNCETVFSQGNQSYMCEPIQIYNDRDIDIAIMMVESNNSKYIALNALMSTTNRRFDGPVSIDFANGRTHLFGLENTQISRIGGRNVSQGVFTVLPTASRSLRNSDMVRLTFRLVGENQNRVYKLSSNQTAMRDQYQCF